MRWRAVLFVPALACLVLFASVPAAIGRAVPGEASALPPDVPVDAWYRAGVLWAVETGTFSLSASGAFRPEGSVTRAQLAKVLWRRAGRPVGVPAADLVDVPSGSGYRRAVDWVVDRGVMEPVRGRVFGPGEPVVRSLMGLALWRWAGSPSGSPVHPFSDVAAGAAYQGAFDWLIDRGIVSARSDGTLRPGGRVTRAQVAMALYLLELAHGNDPPNIVVILTDDQTLESMRVMPQVQRLLGDKGTTFSNAFVTFPLCCPSRATLLTGQYSHNHGVRDNVPPNGGYAALDHTNTLATWLRDGGYATAHVGKYMNCYGSTNPVCGTAGPDVPPGWDDWFGLPDSGLRDLSYFDFDVFDNGTLRHFGPSPEVYSTDVLAQRAVADVGRFAERPQPFFVNIWPRAPHAGLGPTAPNSSSPAPSRDYAGTMADETLPASPSFGEADLSDKPAYVRSWFAARWGDNELPGITAAYRATLEALQSVDDLVGDVVGALREAGELDNTVIVFSSDNGLMFGEHRIKHRKVVPYEESIHVPLIVRGPGFPPGVTAHQIVANIDIAPTLVAMSGVTAGRTMDGRSLLPIARSPAVAADRAVMVEDWPTGTSPMLPHYEGIRTPGWVYLEHDTGERELYDLNADPYQLTSLHAVPNAAEDMGRLAGALARLRRCAGPTCDVTVPLTL